MKCTLRLHKSNCKGSKKKFPPKPLTGAISTPSAFRPSSLGKIRLCSVGCEHLSLPSTRRAHFTHPHPQLPLEPWVCADCEPRHRPCFLENGGGMREATTLMRRWKCAAFPGFT